MRLDPDTVGQLTYLATDPAASEVTFGTISIPVTVARNARRRSGLPAPGPAVKVMTVRAA